MIDRLAKKYKNETSTFLTNLKPKSLLECYLESLAKQQGFEKIADLGAASKAKISEDLMSVLSKIENKIEQTELLKQAAFVLMVKPVDLKPSKSYEPEPEKTPVLSDSVDIYSLSNIDQDILRIIITTPERCKNILADSDFCRILNPLSLAFISELQNIMESESDQLARKEQVKDLLKTLGASWIKFWKEAYLMQEDPLVRFDQAFQDCRLAVQKRILQDAILEINNKLSGFLPETEQAVFYQKKLELSRKLSQIGI